MRHPVGALVRVKESELLLQNCMGDGSLWIVRSYARRNDTYRCKSLATGSIYIWFEDELEEEENNDA